MSEIYLRPVNPESKCKDCAYLMQYTEIHTGKKYCSNLDTYVKTDSLCPDYINREMVNRE